MKLTILLALTSTARASEFGFPDIKYLVQHSFGYIYHFGRYTRAYEKAKSRDPIKVYLKKKNCVCQHVDSFIKGAKEIREQNSQLPLNFVKPHGPVSIPPILRWIIMVLNLSGLALKHSQATQQGQL